MSSAAQPIRLSTAAAAPPRPGRQSRATLAWLAVLVGFLAALFVYWLFSRESLRRAVASLPQGDRVALFERTRATVSTTCADPPKALRSYCDSQAEFLLQFPECDSSCEALAKLRLSPPVLPR